MEKDFHEVKMLTNKIPCEQLMKTRTKWLIVVPRICGSSSSSSSTVTSTSISTRAPRGNTQSGIFIHVSNIIILLRINKAAGVPLFIYFTFTFTCEFPAAWVRPRRTHGSTVECEQAWEQTFFHFINYILLLHVCFA